MKFFTKKSPEKTTKYVEVVDNGNVLIFNLDSLGRVKLVESESTINCSYVELRKLVAKHRPTIKERLC